MKWYKKQLAEKLKISEENKSDKEKMASKVAHHTIGLKKKASHKAFSSPVAASKLSRPKTDSK